MPEAMSGEAERPKPPVKVSALGFLRTGKLGTVSAGMTQADVIHEWGEPTASRLTRPSSICYGPVMLFHDFHYITNLGIYPQLLDAQPPPGFVLDVPTNSRHAFLQATQQAGLHLEPAEDEMREGEPEVVLRCHESGILVVFDAAGRLSCLSQPIATARKQ